MTAPLTLESKLEQAVLSLLMDAGTDDAPVRTIGTDSLMLRVSDAGNEDLDFSRISVEVVSKTPTEGAELLGMYDAVVRVTIVAALPDDYDSSGSQRDIRALNDLWVNNVRAALQIDTLAEDLSSQFADFGIHGISWEDEEMSTRLDRSYVSTLQFRCHGLVGIDL